MTLDFSKGENMNMLVKCLIK